MIDEVPLSSGGVTEVVKVGDTVRRTWRDSTPTVHAFLEHLHRRGVTFVPTPLGRDEQGREVLSYVPGDVPTDPRPAWATAADVIEELAILIRRLHDAAEGWRPPSDAPWGRLPGDGRSTRDLKRPGVLVAHGDYCPGNVVFTDHRPSGFIDFDLAKPTTRVDDCVNAMHWWVPLIDPRDRRAEGLHDTDAAHRVRLFADAYGMDAAQRSAVVPAALERARRSLAWAERSAKEHPLFARWWRERWKDEIPRTIAWLESEQDQLQAVLGRAS